MSDDEYLAELILGDRLPRVSELGPRFGRQLIRAHVGHDDPDVLARTGVAACFLIGAYLDEKQEAPAPLRDTVDQCFSELATWPGFDPVVIDIDRAVLLLPHHALVYLWLTEAFFGGESEASTIKSELVGVIKQSLQGPKATMVEFMLEHGDLGKRLGLR